MAGDTPKHIFEKPLSARRARDVARALKAAGYRISITECFGRTPLDVVFFCEPTAEGRERERIALVAMIVQAARFAPQQLEVTHDNLIYMAQFVR